MSEGLMPPFGYREILIGEEIIYRSLLQQESFAEEGKYAQDWTEQDRIDKGGVYFRLNVMRADFEISDGDQHCIVKPPCPWPKDSDILNYDHFMPVLMTTDGINTYQFDVFERKDNDDGSFEKGAQILTYDLDQSKLSDQVSSEFSYFIPKVIVGDYSGNALLHIQRLHRGTQEKAFFYFFDFE